LKKTVLKTFEKFKSPKTCKIKTFRKLTKNGSLKGLKTKNNDSLKGLKTKNDGSPKKPTATRDSHLGWHNSTCLGHLVPRVKKSYLCHVTQGGQGKYNGDCACCCHSIIVGGIALNFANVNMA
jgi:hypothetical protein